MPRKKNGFDLADLEGSSDDNTWEPEENLGGAELANTYDDAQQKKDKDTVSSEVFDESLASRKRGRRDRKKRVEEIEKPRGVDRGLQPEKILAAQLHNSSLFFLVKWQGCPDLDVVPGKDLNLHHPEFVIDYYESCVPFSVRHKIGKTPRIAPELPPEPEPEPEPEAEPAPEPQQTPMEPMDVSNTEQDQTAESVLLNPGEQPAPPVEPQEMPQDQIPLPPSQPLDVPVLPVN